LTKAGLIETPREETGKNRGRGAYKERNKKPRWTSEDGGGSPKGEATPTIKEKRCLGVPNRKE